MPQSTKDQSIETIRGLAIIMVVIGHVIGHRSNTGMLADDDSVWRYIYYLFGNSMPLFTAISGFVYAMKPVKKGSIIKFMNGKMRRIILPYISVASLQFFVNAMVPGVNHEIHLSEIWKIFVFPYGQFWYLQSLFIVFNIIVILEYYELLRNFRRWATVFLVSGIIFLITNEFLQISLFSFSGFLYLFPYFLLGIGIQKFPAILNCRSTIWISLMILIPVFVFRQFNWFHPVLENTFALRFILMVESVTGILLLLYIRRTSVPLSFVGYYSYPIYLFHVFGTAGSRIILQMLGFHNELIIFLTGVLIGLGLPVLIEMAISKSKFLKRLFLGI